jgi:hypothetical protein
VGRTIALLSTVLIAMPVVAQGGVGAPLFDDVGPNIRLSDDPLATPDEPGGEYQRQSHIAIDPTDTRHLVATAIDGRRMSDGYPLAISYYTSKDAGKTWESGLIPGVSEASGSTEYSFVKDPAVAFGSDGTPYIASLSFDPNGDSALHVSHTAANGEWELPVVVDGDQDGSQVLDKPWIAADVSGVSPFSGRIYVTWFEYEGAGAFTETFVASSDDGGHTWSDPVSITEDQPINGPQIIIEADGALTVVYFTYTGDLIRAVRSDDGGLTWSEPATVAGTEFAHIPGQRTGEDLPSATIDPVTQTMHVVWQDSRRDVADIFHTRSTDGGATWSDPRRVNRGPKGIESFSAAVAAAGGGVHVVFYDGRDPKDRDDLFNLYHAQSTNDGVSFVKPNLRVTSRSFDIDYAAPSAGGLFLGDYIGIAALRKRAHAVWVDTRRPSQVTDAGGQNDVFSALISP